ncbi:ankyrin repeats (3 copies) domain-containing protein [Cordyceps javanica]|nr:ankyrin repeats (3 copies) domain-containing protein [Cordyceps javanica]
MRCQIRGDLLRDVWRCRPIPSDVTARQACPTHGQWAGCVGAYPTVFGLGWWTLSRRPRPVVCLKVEPGIVEAVQAGHFEQVEDLLDAGADPKAKDENEVPILALAVEADRGDTGMVLLLIEREADANAKDRNEVPIVARAFQAGRFKFGELLLGCHADLNAKDGEGVPLIALAVEVGRFELVKLLLEYGADAS